MGKKKVITKSGGEGGEAQVEKKAVPTSKRVEAGRIYINSTYNNTMITVTTLKGDVIAWASSGSLGFSGPKKSTPFAASKVVAALVEKMKGVSVGEIEVFVRGVGSGRDSAIRSLINQGFNITSIKDVTSIPHNGPRKPKPRRV
jgi:small subunit ribosomal protein S11